MNRISLGLKAIQQLGLPQIWQYALYQAGLKSGYLRWATNRELERVIAWQGIFLFHPILNSPDQTGLIDILNENGIEQTLEHANEIIDGRVRLFGGEPQPLRLSLEGKLKHWADYEGDDQVLTVRGIDPSQTPSRKFGDIKMIWEPGRFGWAYTLARAYLLSGKPGYAETFWQNCESFLEHNPPYFGPHWISAQEVALRLIALVFSAQVFGNSPQSTSQRMQRLLGAIAFHAARIPATLPYARAQRNNHLLSEATGLFTAGTALRDLPFAAGWRELGWETFNRGISDQVTPEGVYIQHSANYTRLILQLALWVQMLAGMSGKSLPQSTLERLRAATRWLYALVDPVTGCCPNLGPNDGAYILPLTICPFYDFRPVIQAAGQAFLNESLFPPGGWDEMALWFNPAGVDRTQIIADRKPTIAEFPPLRTPHVIHSADDHSWAYLRAAQFNARPGHADQLHLDLWWQGINIARDPGTYHYNAPPPWDNALRHTQVHNTVCVDSKDQMTPAGRFLYLDWAQAEVLATKSDPSGKLREVTAQHDGYQQLGILHHRSVSTEAERTWLVEDRLLPAKPSVHLERGFTVTVQWLLPDWEWRIDGALLQIKSPFGYVQLELISESNSSPLQLQLTRAGELVYGPGSAKPNWGWYSPTYASKLPALSLRVSAHAQVPWRITSRWIFPEVISPINVLPDEG